MKYIIFLFIITPFTSYSQKIQTGVKIGINLSNISKSNADLRSGFCFGISETYSRNKILIRSGLFFQGNGLRVKENNIDKVYSLDYLQIPLSFSYLMGKSNEKPFIDLGIHGNYLINSKIITYDKSKTSTHVDGLNKFDFGASVACGMAFIFNSKLKALAEIRFSQGFNKIYNGTNQSLLVSANVNF